MIHHPRSLFFIGLLALGLSSSSSWAKKNPDWCIPDKTDPPCGGAKGRCVKNYNGGWSSEKGGFVADTASQQVVKTGWFSKKSAYIGIHAQVCEFASVSVTAIVDGHAVLSGRAQVSGWAQVLGEAKIYGKAEVSSSAMVYGNAQVFGNARVWGHTEVFDHARIFENVMIKGSAYLFGNAQVFGVAEISEGAQISENANVFGRASVSGDAVVSGHAAIFDRAQVSGEATVSGNATVFEDGEVLGNTLLFNNMQVGGHTRLGSASSLTEISDPPLGRKELLSLLEKEPGSPTFMHSDGELFTHLFLHRVRSNEWVKIFHEGSSTFNIESPPNRTLENTYTLTDEIFAKSLGLKIGVPYPFNELTPDNQKIILKKLTEDILFPFVATQGSIPNPEFDPIPITDETTNQIDEIQNEIQKTLRQLPSTNRAHIEQDTFDSRVGIYDNAYDHRVFLSILLAIKRQDQGSFVKWMAHLGRSFPRRHAQAKLGFLHTFSYLYVTGKFPSLGMKKTYFHFLLRCGQLY